MNEPDTPEPHSTPDPHVARLVAQLRQLVPGGINTEIVAVMTQLAESGDAAALRAVEQHLIVSPLAVSYGDRDDDPTWELTPRVFELLARWWERLGLAGERAAWLVADWLNQQPRAERHFGRNSFTFFTRAAPHFASHVAPLLLAACAEEDVDCRAQAVSGLRYAPTSAALDALVALLGDPSKLANEARFGLTLLAYPASPGAPRQVPSAPDEVAPRLLAALESESPLARRYALQSLAWFAGIQHRHSITFPPHFLRAMPAIVRLLADPDPEIQRLAATRVNIAGYHLDALRPSRAAALEPALRLPPLDLRPLLEHADPEGVRAGLYLAGRVAHAGAPPGELAGRILALLDELRGDAISYEAALYALGRLQATAAIPAIARYLDTPKGPFHTQAMLVLARLRYRPALPHLIRLLGDITYADDAREALDLFPPAEVIPLLVEQWRGIARRAKRLLNPNPWDVAYLETHGDAAALAALRQSESYHRAARALGAADDPIVRAARRLERRLLLAAGVPAEEIDDPLAAVRRILAGPIHPLERVAWEREDEAEHSEQRARWRNLCVALDPWLLAGAPELEAALDEAERLLAGFPDELREAHERWWLDITNDDRSAARLSPKAPWRLARALTIDKEIEAAVGLASILAWEGLASISVLDLSGRASWLEALARAPAHVAPRVLRAVVPTDEVAEALLAWPGLARLERLEILWDWKLSDEARAALHARTLAARRK